MVVVMAKMRNGAVVEAQVGRMLAGAVAVALFLAVALAVVAAVYPIKMSWGDREAPVGEFSAIPLGVVELRGIAG